jgi:hypothetical protein
MVTLWTAVVILFLQRQALVDWWRLRGYEPPTEIVALAQDTTLTDSARHLFYVYHPGLEVASTFNQNCTTNNEFSIILGCYVNGRGIYVFKVEDTRLAGVEEVTAAHELLHAAYERLSKKDRQKVDAQLAAVYKEMSNERLKTTIEQYRKSDPSVVPNELHSILGTELRQLTPELESYYDRYFKNRLTVVGYSESYEKAFSDRKAQIDTYESRLKSLQSEITSKSATLEAESKEMAADYQELEAQRYTLTASEFTALANDYNARVATYNRQVRVVSNQINEYNATYDEYKKIVLERQDLYKAIDSRPETLPSQ